MWPRCPKKSAPRRHLRLNRQRQNRLCRQSHASRLVRRCLPLCLHRPRLAPLDPGRSGDVDTRTLDRLRRGQLRPEGRLDLHGMTQAEAHGALEKFIPRAQGAGRRCVIVITGKGSVSAGGGVLRNAVPGWLNAPSLRPSVLAFAEAVPRDGGAGALYVLLRRKR